MNYTRKVTIQNIQAIFGNIRFWAKHCNVLDFYENHWKVHCAVKKYQKRSECILSKLGATVWWYNDIGGNSVVVQYNEGSSILWNVTTENKWRPRSSNGGSPELINWFKQGFASLQRSTMKFSQGQKCYWAFVNLFLADLWRSNSQLCTGWPQKMADRVRVEVEFSFPHVFRRGRQ